MSDGYPIHIKHMVCPRCIRAVQEEIEKLEMGFESIKLGEVVLINRPDDNKLQALQANLIKQGFEIISDHKSNIINRVKTEIIQVIHHGEEIPPHMNFSSYLSEKIGTEYSSLSNLFSSIEGMTIEKYIIFQKVEKIKELIVYNELTFSEIAYQLGYSSSQHLSTQFKKTTGLSPTHFKKIKGVKRNPIDNIEKHR
jgi:AraC family transcriptional regulator